MSFFVRKFGQGISREGIDAPGILSLLETEESQRMTLLAKSDPDHDSHDREDHEDGRTRGGDGDDTTQFQHSNQPNALIRARLARSIIQSLICMRSSKWFARLSLQLSYIVNAAVESGESNWTTDQTRNRSTTEPRGSERAPCGRHSGDIVMGTLVSAEECGRITNGIVRNADGHTVLRYQGDDAIDWVVREYSQCLDWNGSA